jgi:hypothetical protein
MKKRASKKRIPKETQKEMDRFIQENIQRLKRIVKL